MIQEDEEPDRHRKKSHNGHHLAQQPIFSKIRSLNHLALASFGSLFSGAPSSRSGICRQKDDIIPDSLVDFVAGLELDLGPEHNSDMIQQTSAPDELGVRTPEDTDDDLTPHAPDFHVVDYWATRSRTSRRETAISEPHSDSSKSPGTTHISTRFPEVRRFFDGISRSRRAFDQNGCFNLDSGHNAHHEPTMTSAPLASTAVFPSSSSLDGSVFSLSSENQFISNIQGNCRDLETPPLTPDSFNNHVLPSTAQALSSVLAPSLESFRHLSRFALSDTSEEASDDIDGAAIYTSAQLREVKEGKKPEQVVEIQEDNEYEGDGAIGASEDPEEWYGLEYTLELSSRERRPSESQSFSGSGGGEHSKSRESWAAIHRGTIHPFFEDEDYRQWKNWHRFLDRQAEKKRHRKGYEFKSRSKDLAWFYVDEVRTRDILYWQKEVFGVVARDVKERLHYIVERRPDPYFPPQKHDWSWYLKRSRSVACLRELKLKSSAVTGL